MTPGRDSLGTSFNMAAAALRAAAIALAGTCCALPTTAQEAPGRALAVELRVALGDLQRLDEPDLPDRHAEGLHQRLAGALGLLPWLLTRAGRADDAMAIATFAGQTRDATGRAELGALLADLTARTPFALAARASLPQPPAALGEARALHEAYCAGCHDSAGAGDPDALLPARDLRLMARDGDDGEFLARLTLGIKGDETIAFRSPVSDRQLLALRALYAAGFAD